MKTILVNQVKCLQCGDEPFSAHRHDFKHCHCGDIAVDGGMDYLRRVFSRDNSDYMELSVSMDELPFEMCIGALEWSEDTGRNNLGKLCAVVRALRDCGYEIKEIGNE